MEKVVLFRDYQEEQASDHNDLQGFARQSLDHVVHDAVTGSRRFAGFAVTKSSQAEVTVAPGRFYDQDGAVYDRASLLAQSMVPYLAAAAKRIVALSAYGIENETNITERDFLVNVETGQTEPDAVAMVKSRDAVLVFTPGSESADPQPPALPATHVVIAHILLDTIQVVSVTMIDDNRVASTDELDQRTDVVEADMASIKPKVASLASDLAALQNRLNGMGTNRGLQRISEDLARVKESLRYPATASDYGADFYLLPTKSDYQNTFALGYDAKVEEGVRFPDANADQFEISLFSANDPNASVSGGLLLPKYTEEVKLATSNEATAPSDLGIAQYGFQSVEMKQGYMSRSRLRYGGSKYACSNAVNWNGAQGEPAPANLYDFETWETVVVGGEWWDPANPAHEIVRYDSWWYDTWKEPFLYAVTVDHALTGAQIAQTFLASNDTWATKVSVFITAKAANEDIHLALCEVGAGVPDLAKTMTKVTYPHASIVIGWNHVAIPPTFLQKGKKYALVLVANANHKVGMVAGQAYLDGTFFYSTDGIYYQGDLTKDLMFKVWGAKFAASQVAIEFAPINLDGGFRFIDILAEMWVPQSAALIWEMRPNGTGEWLPLTRDNTSILAAAPPLAQFRARFDGTRDMQAALKLTGSRVHVSRPKTALKHISADIELATPSDEIHVKVLLEGFNDTPHDHGCKLHTGVAHDTEETPDTTTTKLLDAAAKRYEREYVFNLAGGNVSHFVIEQTGATNSPQDTYHVAERTYYAA